MVVLLGYLGHSLPRLQENEDSVIMMSFFPLLNTKEDILKNVFSQTVD